MKNAALILICVLGLTGCATTGKLDYDRTGFSIKAPPGITVKTRLKTGRIKMGHSGWIDTVEYSKGVLPKYYCSQPGPHEAFGSYWMYDLRDQEKFMSNLKKVLKANSIYSDESEYTLVIDFHKVEQGPRDYPVYSFDVETTLLKNEILVSKNKHRFKATTMSEEFWTLDAWGGAKSRASHRLMVRVVKDLNDWLAKGEL